MIEAFRNDGWGVIALAKERGWQGGILSPFAPREAFLPRFFAFNLLSLFFSFLGVIRGGIFPLIVGRRFFSPSSFLLFIFFALIFMFFQGGNRGSFSPPIVRIPDRNIQEWRLRGWLTHLGVTDTEVFPPGYFYSLCFVFPGDYKGALLFIVLDPW